MKISTKGRYGLRIMVDIALHESDGPVTLHEIAERQSISEKYLWQVINVLKSAGLVRVTRGARGGYQLARPSSGITLYDIVVPLEGTFELVDCVYSKNHCVRSEQCAARDVWRNLSEEIERLFRSITLETVVSLARKRQNEVNAITFEI
jgi:Rrf2 family protein